VRLFSTEWEEPLERILPALLEDHLRGLKSTNSALQSVKAFGAFLECVRDHVHRHEDCPRERLRKLEEDHRRVETVLKKCRREFQKRAGAEGKQSNEEKM